MTFMKKPAPKLTFDSFTPILAEGVCNAPPIRLDGVVIGQIEREIDSEMRGSSRAYVHHVVGYKVELRHAKSCHPPVFKALGEARDYVRSHVLRNGPELETVDPDFTGKFVTRQVP
jgi:hypothetical protein